MKEDRFWTNVIIVLVFYLVFYFFFTYDNYSDANELIKNSKEEVTAIKALNTPDLPGKPMLDRFRERKAKLQDEYKELTKFYMDKDLLFESWFKELDSRVTSNVESSRFKPVLQKRIDDLKKELTSADNKGTVASEDAIQFVTEAQDTRLLQKCFWMFAQFHRACKKTSVPEIQKCNWGNPSAEKTIGFVDNFEEDDEAEEEGVMRLVSKTFFGYTTIPMEVTVQIPYAGVAPFLEETLAYIEDSNVMFSLKEMRVYKASYDPKKDQYQEPMNVSWTRYEEEEKQEEELNNVLGKIKEYQSKTHRNVFVELQLVAYDFFERTEKVTGENQ